MNNEHAFLTYSIVRENDIHKGYSLNPKGLSHNEVQSAIDLYVSEVGENKKTIARLNSLIDQLLNENKKYKKDNDWYKDNYTVDYKREMII